MPPKTSGKAAAKSGKATKKIVKGGKKKRNAAKSGQATKKIVKEGKKKRKGKGLKPMVLPSTALPDRNKLFLYLSFIDAIAKPVTIMPKDIQLGRRIHGDYSPIALD